MTKAEKKGVNKSLAFSFVIYAMQMILAFIIQMIMFLIALKDKFKGLTQLLLSVSQSKEALQMQKVHSFMPETLSLKLYSKQEVRLNRSVHGAFVDQD